MALTDTLVKNGMSFIQQLEFPRKHPIEEQNIVLKKLLKKAVSTEFGQFFSFKELLKEADLINIFQQTVPYFEYNQIFKHWWLQSLNGKPDVTWPGQIKHFALSSGTSNDASKYIPVSEEMRRAMGRAGFRMFACLPKYKLQQNVYFKDWLMIGGSANLKEIGQVFAGDLSGINAKIPPFWLRRFYKPGTKVAQLPSWEERTAEIVKNAPQWDVSILAGVPSWVQLTLEHILDFYRLDTIHQLWPNLSIFVTGGIAFGPYQKGFEKLLAKPLIYQDTYLASEGFIAFQDRPDTNAMRLLTNNGIFFEFLPFDDANFDPEGSVNPNAKALAIDQIEEGVDYALVISTCAGAWRYLIGDTIRFTDKDRCEIIITGRTKHFLSVCGEHLSVENMNQAIQALENKLDINIREFTVSAVESGTHFAHQWYLGTDAIIAPATIANYLDDELKKINDDYRAERGAMLYSPRVVVIPAEWFKDWLQVTDKMTGQTKIPRVMKGKILKKWNNFINHKFESQFP